MILEKSLRDSFNLKVIPQGFFEGGSENKVLFTMPSDDRIEATVYFKHLKHFSEWEPANFCKINEIPHHHFDEVMSLLGNGDDALGIDIFDELISASLDEDRQNYIIHEQEIEAVLQGELLA